MKTAPAIEARKRRLRRRAEAVRHAMPEKARRAAAAAIARRILALPQYGRARVVAVYLALPAEARLDGVIRHAWRHGKRVCVPVFAGGPGLYEWSWLEAGARLRQGRHGIREPLRPLAIGRARIDLALVPGVAFDRRGRRLGRGEGCYDRLLAQPALRRGFAVGVAFDSQLARRVPASSHDRRVDMVVTERGSWTAGRSQDPPPLTVRPGQKPGGRRGGTNEWNNSGRDRARMPGGGLRSAHMAKCRTKPGFRQAGRTHAQRCQTGG